MDTSTDANNLASVQIKHIVADFVKCNMTQDASVIEKVMREAARQCGATPLEFTFHQFQPGGFSAMLILAESHISIHYWYLEKYAAIDVVTCGICDPMLALLYLEDIFEPKLVIYDHVKRPCK